MSTDVEASGQNPHLLSQPSSSQDGQTELSRHGLPSAAMRKVFNGDHDGEEEDDAREMASP